MASVETAPGQRTVEDSNVRSPLNANVQSLLRLACTIHVANAECLVDKRRVNVLLMLPCHWQLSCVAMKPGRIWNTCLVPTSFLPCSQKNCNKEMNIAWFILWTWRQSHFGGQCLPASQQVHTKSETTMKELLLAKDVKLKCNEYLWSDRQSTNKTESSKLMELENGLESIVGCSCTGGKWKIWRRKWEEN